MEQIQLAEPHLCELEMPKWNFQGKRQRGLQSQPIPSQVVWCSASILRAVNHSSGEKGQTSQWACSVACLFVVKVPELVQTPALSSSKLPALGMWLTE